jgi:hypothetical protein
MEYAEHTWTLYNYFLYFILLLGFWKAGDIVGGVIKHFLIKTEWGKKWYV